MANKGLVVGIPDPKNVSRHPGADWHPGWGVYPNYTYLVDTFSSFQLRPFADTLPPFTN